ncbi:antitoxin VbhA family protein [Piscibacillus sp. B03]|uniref:antitoxin VbhA family protein n=1 Tax=Piscibacillus sp. B03 TaxID=3457430 RepID=UPI003FCC2AB4
MKKDKKAIQQALDSAKGSLAIENLHLSKEEERLIEQRLAGELSEEEFIKKVLEQQDK